MKAEKSQQERACAAQILHPELLVYSREELLEMYQKREKERRAGGFLVNLFTGELYTEDELFGQDFEGE